MNNRYKDPYEFEKDTASKINKARRSIASGAIFGDMDVSSPDVLIDNKRVSEGYTYRLDYRDFKKVQDQSKVDQVPMMLINFNKYGKNLAILREEDAIAFINSMNEE